MYHVRAAATLLLAAWLSSGGQVAEAQALNAQQRPMTGNAVADVISWPIFRAFSCTLWPRGPSCTSDEALLTSAGGQTDELSDDQSYGGEEVKDVHTDRHHSHGWVYLIRHGEKVKHSDKTGLSARGLRRARCLQSVFGDRGDQIDYILAQDYKPDGRRKRPYDTVAPLANALDIPLDHACDREDTRCVVKKIERHANERRENVLVVWEHARLSNIAKGLGVKGLRYPSDRYDVIFKIRKDKVHAIYSEECDGLDQEWIHWHGKKKGKHGKGGRDGRLIDDESWAEDVEEEPGSPS